MFEYSKSKTKIFLNIYENCKAIVKKIEGEIPLSTIEHEAILRLPTNCLICFLHGFIDATTLLLQAKNYLRNLEDKTTYIKYKEAMRVIRKVKYN